MWCTFNANVASFPNPGIMYALLTLLLTWTKYQLVRLLAIFSKNRFEFDRLKRHRPCHFSPRGIGWFMYIGCGGS